MGLSMFVRHVFYHIVATVTLDGIVTAMALDDVAEIPILDTIVAFYAFIAFVITLVILVTSFLVMWRH
jgi:hypothetical protein